MTIRVGINGFGRIGRLVLRAAWNFDPRDANSLSKPSGVWGDGPIEIVHINELKGDAEVAAHHLIDTCRSIDLRNPAGTTLIVNQGQFKE